VPVTSGGIRNSAIEFMDPENEGLAVGTALLSSLEAEIFTSGLGRHIGCHFESVLVKNSPFALWMLPWFML
jgi:hypothetical protein